MGHNQIFSNELILNLILFRNDYYNHLILITTIKNDNWYIVVCFSVQHACLNILLKPPTSLYVLGPDTILSRISNVRLSIECRMWLEWSN